MVKELIMSNNIVVGMDFDGTCVTHSYPNMGKDIGADKWLKIYHKECNVDFVLNTMRSDSYLEDAIKWFEDIDVPLIGANENPSQKEWTTSPKVYAHIYVDDAALGCPLQTDPNISSRPFVNWDIAGPLLYLRLPKKDG